MEISPVALPAEEIAKPEGKHEGDSGGLRAQESCFDAYWATARVD